MPKASREQLLLSLHEAAEIEHNLMCTYLYAAWSLKDRGDPGVDDSRHAVLSEWRQSILRVAVEEMSHLVSVWNITVALGGTPHIGRVDFPLPPGALPASMVVRLAPFSRDTLQHFIFLERPAGSAEPDGEGFERAERYDRGNRFTQHTPMPENYATVGEFYSSLKSKLDEFVAMRGESLVFSGDRELQISGVEFGLPRARPVVCLKTAREAFDAIIAEGEGATAQSEDSHFSRFMRVRQGLDALQERDPAASFAYPAATNPVLRAPPKPAGRVWLEDPAAVATVDLANAAYGLMLRAIAYAFAVRSSEPRKAEMLRLSMRLMHAISPLAEAAARLPAGPSNPGVNAGMSFTTLRGSVGLPPGPGADLLVIERLREFAEGAAKLAPISRRHEQAAAQFAALEKSLEATLTQPERKVAAPPPSPTVAPIKADLDHGPSGTRIIKGQGVEVHYQGVRCIHARFCVTGAPAAFVPNVEGEWIHPDRVSIEHVVEIAHACPSGAIAYRRLDGGPDESAPPVNLAAIREGGPLAFRGALVLNGEPAGMRATLCRCGASSHKPFCDGSHKSVSFAASGEPSSQDTAMLPVRDGPLHITPERNGPLQIEGNLEIVSGTGRVVARVTAGRLCRCGASGNKPFCDGTHLRIGFVTAES